jgi:two-component system, chemotaxis family, CheB/CheR fusion protein
MATKKSTATPPLATTQDFPIVGVGASAGGLDAFRQFIIAIPENSGMAYVLVQHLYASHESILPEILSRYTNIPVFEITDDIHLAPNRIYVIPENKIVTSSDGVLKLSPREKKSRNAAIDIFFVSLAEVHLSLAVGIVLSGMGTDGTLGLKTIKKNGGITFAQTHDTAAHSQMPLNAVNAETVDYVMKPAEMPGKLMILKLERESLNKKNPAAEEENAFKEIILLLRKSSTVDFTYYKQSTIRRRITRRMAINKNKSLKEYLNVLQHDAAAPAILFNDLLIPVTTFFRDPAVFSEVKETLLPVLVQGKNNDDAIRVWVAGCSTGEEAYSFAIALMEYTEAKAPGRQIQLFASDISQHSLSEARKAFYKTTQVANVPAALLEKYFDKKENGYQIKKPVRDLCVFAAHNFLKDPPFARMDLISCRNVLIYMDPFIQKKALTTFHYALSDKGFLLLGKSETAALAPELFKPYLKTSKIYARKTTVGRYIHQVVPKNHTTPLLEKNKETNAALLKTDFVKSAQALLLSDFTPASVIINDQMDVVHVNGNIVPYIEFAQGKPTFNLLKIARAGLTFELRNALSKVKDQNIAVVKEGISIKYNGEIIDVTIEIRPLNDIVETYYLIVFKQAVVPEKGNTKFISLIQQQINSENVNLRRISVLEKELLQTHTDVNAIAEQQEASNEELQSANEELLSGSEELQSLNEELETSKEELQSSNEELIIINAELLDKQEEINISKYYIEAIVATLREPIVVLDNDLRIKKINRAFVKKYGITKEQAHDKLIYEIANGLFENKTMRSLLENVLLQSTQMDDYEITLNVPTGQEGTLLLNARQVTNEHSKEQLILLAIEDITERKITERSLKLLSDGFEAKVKERTAELETSNADLGISIRDLNSANIRLQQFAYIASHDLQEPLRKIQTFISILQRGGIPIDAARLLDKISTSSERMKTLIQDLLAYSYLANDEALYVTTDLNNIIKNILIDFELLIEQNHVEVICGDLPLINAIPLQMNQLFYNLISNAIKFMPEYNASRIEIASKKLAVKELTKFPTLDKALTWYDITVRDNGIGFEQKYEKQIYTIFQRLNNNDIYKGTGIGLAISYKIVENHGGIIFAESKLNEGATFHVILHE